MVRKSNNPNESLNLSIFLSDQTEVIFNKSRHNSTYIETETEAGFVTDKAIRTLAGSIGMVERDYTLEGMLKALGVSHSTRQDDEYGESYHEVWTFPAGTPTETIGRIVNLEGTFCTHEYDCCANWYRGHARIDRSNPALVTVTQGVYMNV